MAYAYRGRRVAYDNVAVGSIAGKEHTISMSTVQDNISAVTDPSLYNVREVSAPGNVLESLTAGAGTKGTFTNIANAVLPGIEDTENSVGDKLTSDHEDISDAG